MSRTTAAQVLINGGVVSGVISTTGGVDSYSFTATADDGLFFQLVDVSGTFTPYMRLYKPSGALVTFAHADNVAPLQLTAPSAGTYTLVASDWNAVGVGDYDLHFVKAPSANEGGALSGGSVVAGTIELGDLDSFTFEAIAGDDIELQLVETNGTALTPCLSLYTPDGGELFTAHDDSSAAFPVTAPASGTYTLDLAGYPLALPTGPLGEIALGGTWPAGIPGGLTMYIQYWIVDPAGPVGFSASNGLAGTTR